MRIRDGVATFRGHRVPSVNLIGRRNWWFALSGTFILLSLVGLFVRGLNFSIEFKGGSQLQFQDKSGYSVQDFQAIMARFGLPDARVEIIGGQNCPTGCVQIRTKSLTELGLTPAVTPSASAPPTTGASATPTSGSAPPPHAGPAPPRPPPPPGGATKPGD